MNRNKKNTNKQYSYAQVHPSTIKAFKQGHPHVTMDRYSAKFAKHSLFIIARDAADKELAILLNDPIHSKIKARIWKKVEKVGPVEDIHNFYHELLNRLNKAALKRGALKLASKRDNYYLIFGEADQLPGLYIQVLGKNLVIQYTSFFWSKVEKKLLLALSEILKTNFSEFDGFNIWIQQRKMNQTCNWKAVSALSKKVKVARREFAIEEFGLKYQIKLSEHYDLGIFSDMSSIRSKLTPYFKRAKSVCNLFSYTGAFSLNALANGATRVVSVDLSPKYAQWLEQNLQLNSSLNHKHHTMMVSSVGSALLKLKKQQELFDLIICDPPSSSSDGKKTSAALKNYETLLPKILDQLTEAGVAIIFLNTHNVTWKKFEDKIIGLLKESDQRKFKIIKRLKLDEDCLPLPKFTEGNYLKGLVIGS
ncbi:MAG: class I SAM-dependent methyltransferase [Bacteriovoracaceae bacterium]|nr:class I SAM-dependent methyltransferase [Bacteriovoracaceae bacterium]